MLRINFESVVGMEIKIFNLELPVSGNGAKTVEIESGQSIVIIGANGSGKTRLGTWIEFQSRYENKVHRISAQKSLSMPEVVSSSDLTKAEEEFLFGSANPTQNYGTKSNAKKIARWGQKPNTFLLNDFEKLMIVLFSEEASISIDYRQSKKNNLEVSSVPETRLDKVKAIWESLLPHCELIISGQKIEAKFRDSQSLSYNGAEMSDGERVIFYLIAQSLYAPQNSIIIIDEPELHIHKSIQTLLWREIQAARPDCLFVYMTHDLEFAASLTEAKKIWLKSFDGETWQWDEVIAVEDFPEELLLKVLGSRRPILFVEGESGSYDVALFQALYSNYTVIPRGSCSQVKFATRALSQASNFHHLRVHGIIDRDRLNFEEVSSLSNEGVKVLSLAEIENLFCVPEVLKLVAKQQELSEFEKLEDAKKLVFRELQNALEAQISLHVADEIKFRLNVFNTKKKGAEALKEELNLCASRINIDDIYTNVENQFNEVIENQNYIGALCVFNRKGLATQMSGIFEIKDLPSYILRMVQGKNSEEWIQAFSNYVPNFDS